MLHFISDLKQQQKTKQKKLIGEKSTVAIKRFYLVCLGV